MKWKTSGKAKRTNYFFAIIGEKMRYSSCGLTVDVAFAKSLPLFLMNFRWVEYQLTPLGESFLPVLKAMLQWGLDHYQDQNKGPTAAKPKKRGRWRCG